MFARVINLQSVDFLTICRHFDVIVQNSHPIDSRIQLVANNFLQKKNRFSWIFLA